MKVEVDQQAKEWTFRHQRVNKTSLPEVEPRGKKRIEEKLCMTL